MTLYSATLYDIYTKGDCGFVGKRKMKSKEVIDEAQFELMVLEMAISEKIAKVFGFGKVFGTRKRILQGISQNH
jgi:hypothetical protein